MTIVALNELLDLAKDDVRWEAFDSCDDSTAVNDMRALIVDSVSEAMFEIGERYIELPIDANGKPLHPGDKVRTVHLGTEMVASVTAITGNGRFIECVPAAEEYYGPFNAEDWERFAPDSWEGIEEDARKAMSTYSMPHVVMDLVYRCKRLAEYEKAQSEDEML